MIIFIFFFSLQKKIKAALLLALERKLTLESQLS